MSALVLSGDQRGVLERAVVSGRGVVEVAVGGVLARLGVVDSVAPGHLSEVERGLRVGLRARARALGDVQVGDGFVGGVSLLAAEVAYVQWHRLLFARFLEANGLLMHPEFGASVSLAECDELAEGLGEPDGWGVASRFAAAILPGIFRPDDPAARVRLATEDRLALEEVVVGLPDAVLTATDALGWVYQYWQSKAKKQVNESGRKIGGADLSPVTQLFTEDYMVRFLLENSLGAWWAGKHPESPLLVGFEYLRFDEESGLPAAGTFEGWPGTVAEVTMMDPCCGSGHFLVAGFHMLSAMRVEEEGLDLAAAQEAVLTDNLFGLELDPRCTQIAMFALALEAWKTAGYRVLPVPNVACSGIPAKAPLKEWTDLADGDYQLEQALTRLHSLFKDADTLGSLIDPVRAAEQDSLDSVDWHQIAPILQTALTKEAARSGDPAAEVFGHAAAGIARAADLLTNKYTLIATNPPYLAATKQVEVLKRHCAGYFYEGRADVATAMLLRMFVMAREDGSILSVSPDKLLNLGAYQTLRTTLLRTACWRAIARIGVRGFSTPMFDLGIVLGVWQKRLPDAQSEVSVVSAQDQAGPTLKAAHLVHVRIKNVRQLEQLRNPDARFSDGASSWVDGLLSDHCRVFKGLTSGDDPRFRRRFWEFHAIPDGVLRFQTGTNDLRLVNGCSDVVRMQSLVDDPPRGYRPMASNPIGSRGVAVGNIGLIRAALYLGGHYDQTMAAVVPNSKELESAVWSFCRSDEYETTLREIDSSIKVTDATLVKVPFDVERWQKVGAKQYPDGLPEPCSDDPTQWLFKGCVSPSTESLQVAIGRLLAFAWPDQEPDELDRFADADGIVCVPPVAGELPAAERVRQVLAAGFGEDWSASKLDELLVAAGAKAGASLEAWLRDGFAKNHNKVFLNRPFVWQIWDGRKDGFSALVNYHRLDRATLEKLTYTMLGWWIDQQRSDAESEITGAEARLVAATGLQDRLKLIIEGEPPYDIYVRWKSPAEQPIGWDPDLDDGVRLNIRPFVEAKVLRAAPNVNWKKDRGTNPDGTERHNDLHYSRAEKLAARGSQ